MQKAMTTIQTLIWPTTCLASTPVMTQGNGMARRSLAQALAILTVSELLVAKRMKQITTATA